MAGSNRYVGWLKSILLLETGSWNKSVDSADKKLKGLDRNIKKTGETADNFSKKMTQRFASAAGAITLMVTASEALFNDLQKVQDWKPGQAIESSMNSATLKTYALFTLMSNGGTILKTLGTAAKNTGSAFDHAFKFAGKAFQWTTEGAGALQILKTAPAILSRAAGIFAKGLGASGVGVGGGAFLAAMSIFKHGSGQQRESWLSTGWNNLIAGYNSFTGISYKQNQEFDIENRKYVLQLRAQKEAEITAQKEKQAELDKQLQAAEDARLGSLMQFLNGITKEYKTLGMSERQLKDLAAEDSLKAFGASPAYRKAMISMIDKWYDAIDAKKKDIDLSNRLKDLFQQTESPVERINKQIADLNEGYRQGKVAIDDYRKAYQRLTSTQGTVVEISPLQGRSLSRGPQYTPAVTASADGIPKLVAAITNMTAMLAQSNVLHSLAMSN